MGILPSVIDERFARSSESSDTLRTVSGDVRRIGRPPRLDRATILHRAAAVFSRTGYEGVAVPDLAAELGLTHTSLYAAFGSKADLYAQTLEAHADRWRKAATEALAEPDLTTAFKVFLQQQARWLSGLEPDGGLLTRALLTHAGRHHREAATARRLRGMMVRTVERRVMAAGSVRDRSARILALTVMGQVHGMAVLAASGVPPVELEAVAAGFARMIDLDNADARGA